MKTLRQLRSKAAFDIVVYSKVSFNYIGKIAHDFISIFVKKTLQLAHLLIIIEVLFVLCIQLRENILKVFQCLNKLCSTSLLSQI